MDTKTTQTKKTTRTDPHRPGAIIPADYSPVLFYALASSSGGFALPPLNIDLAVDMMRTEKFAATGGIGHCSVCGAVFIEGEIWRHNPSGEHIHVGHICAEKYDLIADWSVELLERGRQKEARATEILKAKYAEERRRFLEKHDGLEDALKTDHQIVRDIAQRFVQWRELSPKQIALVMKIAAEANKPPEEQEKTVAAPIVDGRQTFRGTVVSAKSVEGDYGTAYKMTVKIATSDGVWLAWGTVPRSLLDEVPCGQRGRIQNMRGCEVEMTAGLQAGREPHFAVMKRPVGKVIALGDLAREEQALSGTAPTTETAQTTPQTPEAK